ncbi:MAG TPA: GNAT family protein [Ktedonobacterales bacterium]
MTFSFTPMTEADARSILAWRYEPPYTTYNAPDAALESSSDYLRELLDTRSPHFAVREAGNDAGDERAEPIGFFAYGSGCEVGGDVGEPYLTRPDGSLTIGLGLRPDRTGRGTGLALVEAGLAYARDHYAPTRFRLYVYEWNERAIRVYERAGFTRVGERRVAAPEGERVFIEMMRLP